MHLSELDAFVEKLKSEYDRQDSYRKPQKEYSQTLALAHYWEKKRKAAVEQGDEAEAQRAKARYDLRVWHINELSSVGRLPYLFSVRALFDIHECKSCPGFFRHYAELPKVHQREQTAPPAEKWHL